MNEQRVRPVVAGFDTSPSAAAALEVAATEALALGVPLLLVHAYPWPIFYASLTNVPFRADDWQPSPETAQPLEAAAARLAARHPGLRVEVSVRAGAAGSVLVEASAQACLVVVGARGVGGLGGRLAGSVVSPLAAHAACPVMVVRDGSRTGEGDVCVGVDGSASSLRALRWACQWAARHGASVRAVHAIEDEFDEPAPEFGAHTPAYMHLEAWISELGDESAGVHVEPVVVRRGAADALLATSGTARLLVVGSRHRGELRSLVLGSVGHTLIRRATCPVVVVHGQAGEPDGDTTVYREPALAPR